ncbi:MAG: FecR domain-containing protein [Erythrobacter sp.]
MQHLSRVLLPLLVLLIGGTSAIAQNGAWTVSEAKGVVLVVDARGQRAAKAGTELAAGATVRTEARSSAVLVRGKEFVTLRQNAQLRIPTAAAARERSLVQIIQDYGSALFSIGKQPNPHFGVETPYLAAVVKGTTFVITVSRQAATLQVTEGAVEASTREGAVRELIRPGAVAMIAAGDPLRMVIEGDGKRVVDSPARGNGGAAAAPSGEPGSAFEAASQDSGAAPPAPTQARSDSRLDQPVVSTPQSLGRMSNGFVGGEVAVLALAAASDTGRGKLAQAPVSNAPVRIDDGAACFGSTCAPGGAAGGASSDKGAGNPAAGGPDDKGSGSDNGKNPIDDKGAGNGSPGNGSPGKGDDNGKGTGNDASDPVKGKGHDNDKGSDNDKGGSDKGKGNDSDKGGDDDGSDSDKGKGKGDDDGSDSDKGKGNDNDKGGGDDGSDSDKGKRKGGDDGSDSDK